MSDEPGAANRPCRIRFQGLTKRDYLNARRKAMSLIGATRPQGRPAIRATASLGRMKRSDIRASRMGMARAATKCRPATRPRILAHCSRAWNVRHGTRGVSRAAVTAAGLTATARGPETRAGGKQPVSSSRGGWSIGCGGTPSAGGSGRYSIRGGSSKNGGGRREPPARPRWSWRAPAGCPMRSRPSSR